MRRRIVVCLGLLLVLCLLGGVIALLSLDRSISQLNSLAKFHRIQSMRVELASGSVRIDRDLLGYLAGHGHAAAAHDKSVQRFQRAVRRCSGCHHDAEVQRDLDEVTETFRAYRDSAGALMSQEGSPERHSSRRRAERLADQLVEKTTALSDRAGEHLKFRSADAAASVHYARMALYVTLAVVLVVGGAVAFHLLRRLTRPVDALLEGLERVRQGDLSYRFSFEADAEFRTLANAFNDAYKSLQHAQEGMVQVDKMAAVGKLAAGVAHEIGNPLASISSIAQIMRRQAGSPEQAERLELIMGEINRISRIVRDLLSFSRAPAGEMHGRVDVDALLEQAATLLGYDKRAADIAVTLDTEPSLQPVRGNRDKLLLVFTNIMINAYDALCEHRQGKGTLEITARQRGDQVELSFADNGPGMSEEQIAYAFEPFYTTKEPGAGTGLGLWICYQEIQRHQGSIQIKSRGGRGTTVLVTVPCDTEEMGRTSAGSPVREPGQTTRPTSAASTSRTG